MKLLGNRRGGKTLDLVVMWRGGFACLRRCWMSCVLILCMSSTGPGVAPLLTARWHGVPRVLATIDVPASEYGRRRWWPRLLANRLCDAFLCV